MKNQTKNSRKAMLLIANALVWAGAMLAGAHLFKEAGWSNDMVMWMIVGYMTVNGLLASALGKSRPHC